MKTASQRRQNTAIGDVVIIDRPQKVGENYALEYLHQNLVNRMPRMA